LVPGSAQGNGGATSPGLTATEIRVAFPEVTSGASELTNLAPLVAFFNTHFELYGRQIVLAPFPSQQGTQAYAANDDAVSATAQKADAEQAASLNVLAATDFTDNGGELISALPTYLDTLASHRVVALAGGNTPPLTSPQDLQSHAPYEWTYEPTSTDLFANFGQMVCRALVGHNATHASAYADVTRKFALLLPDPSITGGPLAGESALSSTLAGCGVSGLRQVYYTNSTSDVGALSESFVQLKAAGVTSLLFYPLFSGTTFPPEVASTAAYDPEWVTLSWEPLITADFETNGTPNETNNTFGIAEWNRLLPLSRMPWDEAYLEAGGLASNTFTLDDANDLYHELLLLASGAQMAGPRLTPQTFAQALAATTFANPGAAAAPSYQATVGFAATSHAMVDDYAEFWFDPSGNAASTLEALRSQAGDSYQDFCYVGLGARWSDTDWPDSDNFYSSPCR